MYNRYQIDKNLMLFESSLNEVFAKLSLDYSNKILRERAEVTLQLADHVRDSLREYNDDYIKGVIKKIDLYHARFEEIKSKYLSTKKDLTTV